EVVGLQHHVVELEERQRLLALEPEPHAVETQHAVHREMPAVFAQKWNVMQTVEPISVVRHDGAGGAVAEAEEAVEDSANAGLVTLALGLGQQLARLVLAGG